jgi:hypothetical protein
LPNLWALWRFRHEIADTTKNNLRRIIHQKKRSQYDADTGATQPK